VLLHEGLVQPVGSVLVLQEGPLLRLRELHRRAQSDQVVATRVVV